MTLIQEFNALDGQTVDRYLLQNLALKASQQGYFAIYDRITSLLDDDLDTQEFIISLTTHGTLDPNSNDFEIAGMAGLYPNTDNIVEEYDSMPGMGKGVEPDDIYTMVSNIMLNYIKKHGALPAADSRWKKGTGKQFVPFNPINFISKKEYRGVNWQLLQMKPIDKNIVGDLEYEPRITNNPYYLTGKQITELEGSIKKGTIANKVVYFIQLYKFESPEVDFGTYNREKFKAWYRKNKKKYDLDRELKKDGKDYGEAPSLGDNKKDPADAFADRHVLPLLKYYNVFHADDITGIEWGELPEDKTVLKDFEKIAAADQIIEDYEDKPDIKNGFDHAAYFPGGDYIEMPHKEDFKEDVLYYATLFHELVHSTGHEKKLNRDFAKKKKEKAKYYFEELIAELGASFLSAKTGILHNHKEISASYLKGYYYALQELMEKDNKFYFRASSKAQAAVDYMQGIVADYNKPKKTSKKEDPKEERPEPKFKKGDTVKQTYFPSNKTYTIDTINFIDGAWHYSIVGGDTGTQYNIPEIDLVQIEEIKKIDIAEQIGYKEFIELFKSVESGKISLQDFKTLYKSLMDSEEKIKEELTKTYTVKELKRYSYHSGEKKSFYVDENYGQLLMRFTVGMVSFGFNETRSQVILRMIEAADQEYLDKIFKRYEERRKEQKERAEKIGAAKKDPQTLEEFEIYLRAFGKVTDLTDEQLKRYDTLRTLEHFEKVDKAIVQRAERRFNQVASADISGVGFELNETTHSRKGHDLFVVSMLDRVDKDVYRTLVATAKSMGGYYSSYNKEGAIPGFQFLDKETAQAFMNKSSSNEPPIEPKDVLKVRDKKLKEQREKLIHLLENRIERADESLNQDRKTNTNKRSREAASAIDSANNEIALSKAGITAVKCIMDKGCVALRNLTAMTELEQVYSIVRIAANDYRRAKNINSESMTIEQVIQKTDFSEIVHFIKAPKLELYGENLERVLKETVNKKGLKLLSKRIAKKGVIRKSGEHIYYNFSPAYLDDILKLIKASSYNYTNSVILTVVQNFKRAHVSLGFQSPSIVRLAARELYSSLRQSNIFDESKEKEKKNKETLNKIRSSKIDGFFPTPDKVITKLLRNVAIEDGDTILEPSAGIGSIADRIKEEYPTNDLHIIEFNYTLVNYLKSIGYEDVEAGNFLDHKKKYDVIVMNPPFENDQDIDHVMHAYSLLKPGGRIAAVMAANKFNSSRKKRKEFETFIHNNGWHEENEPGAFKSSFRSTGVNTINVYLEKGEFTPTKEPKKTTSQTKKGKLTSKKIKTIVADVEPAPVKVNDQGQYGMFGNNNLPTQEINAPAPIVNNIASTPTSHAPVKTVARAATGANYKGENNNTNSKSLRFKGPANPLFNIQGPTGAFLGKLERKPQGSIIITIDAKQGAGKTTAIWKFMNDVAASGYKILFASLEEHPSSNLFQEKIDNYIDPQNENLISVVSEFKNYADFKKEVALVDFIFTDSWQKLEKMLPKVDMDKDIRNAFDGKVFPIIFQQTTDGRTKGGADKVFDADIVIKGETGSSFDKNYFYADKHRYTDGDISKMAYNVAGHYTFDPTTTIDTPELNTQDQYITIMG